MKKGFVIRFLSITSVTFVTYLEGTIGFDFSKGRFLHSFLVPLNSVILIALVILVVHIIVMLK